jgi:hypothetical protein
VTSDQFQIFAVVLKQRRRKWLWSVSASDGKALIEGLESSRPAAKYNANRALFLLLLSAPYRLINPGPFGPLRDHGSSEKSG